MKRNIFAIFFLLAVISVPGGAEIKNLTCTVTSPTDFAKKYNNGQAVSVSATWENTAGVATPPFAATFKAGGTALGSANTSDPNANFTVSALNLSDTAPNTFSVSVIETSVPGAVSVEKPAAGSIQVDRTAPQITLTVTGGAVVSPQTGFNEVTFQFVSDEPLGEAPKFVVSPGAFGNPAPVIPEASPFNVNIYKLTVPAGTANGNYTIRATCKDATEPAASRNEGSGQTSFLVDSLADGAPSIHSVSPNSPIRIDAVTLNGTVSSETGSQKVEVLEGGSVKGATTVAGGTTNWSVSISSLAEGTHKFTARRTDSLGNVSPEGSEFTVIADRTAPGKPILTAFAIPVNTGTVRIVGSGSTDAPHNSFPIKMSLIRDGTAIAVTNANNDGSFAFDNVPLISGNNVVFAQAADTTFDGSGSAGNQSAYSSPITVVLDQGKPVVVGGGVVISLPGSGTRDLAAATPGIVLQADVASDAIQAPSGTFFPPIRKTDAGFLTINLPVGSVQDRFADRTSVHLVFRPIDNLSAGEETLTMAKDETKFSSEIPLRGTGIFYRFVLRDPAGNVSFFPATGEFVFHSRRVSVLKILPESSFHAITPSEDEWPANSLGMPPLERILAYRQLSADVSLFGPLQQLLKKAGNLETVSVNGQVFEISTGFPEDFELLTAGRLPAGRVSLLLDDISSGKIPPQILPDPVKISNQGEFRLLRDAIQFQRLHEAFRK